MKLHFAPWKNPVLVKEVRTRMRGSRSFMVVTAYLVAFVIFIGLAYAFFQISLSSSRSPDERRLVGKLLFGLALWIQLVIVSFTAPALTAGAIAAERERQTFDLLRVTLLRRRRWWAANSWVDQYSSCFCSSPPSRCKARLFWLAG